jgi:hypothetical protein
MSGLWMLLAYLAIVTIIGLPRRSGCTGVSAP